MKIPDYEITFREFAAAISLVAYHIKNDLDGFRIVHPLPKCVQPVAE